MNGNKSIHPFIHPSTDPSIHTYIHTYIPKSEVQRLINDSAKNSLSLGANRICMFRKVNVIYGGWEGGCSFGILLAFAQEVELGLTVQLRLCGIEGAQQIVVVFAHLH